MPNMDSCTYVSDAPIRTIFNAQVEIIPKGINPNDVGMSEWDPLRDFIRVCLSNLEA